MSIVINPSQLANELIKQNAELKETLAQITPMANSINAYIEEGELTAESFDLHKDYLREGHTPFLKSLRIAIDSLIQANNAHIRAINAHLSPEFQYNQRLIQDNIDWANGTIDRLRYMIETLMQIELEPTLQARIEFLNQWNARRFGLEGYLIASQTLYELAMTAIHDAEAKLRRIEYAYQCSKTGAVIP